MQARTPRIVALVAAPLLVVAATALVLLPRGGATPPTPSADGPTVEIVEPAQGAILPVATVDVIATADDPDGIAAAELRVDGERVATSLPGGASTTTLEFVWKAQRADTATISVRARDGNGKWGEAVITVSVGTGLPPLPPPPTTAFATTVSPATTSSSTTTVVAGSTTTTGRTTVPTPPPTTGAAPPTVPPPTTTLAPTTAETTTSTTSTSTTTSTTTTSTTTTTTTPTPTVGQNCRVSSAFGISPGNRSSDVALQPRFAWFYAGFCPPTAQLLRISLGGSDFDIALSGTARSHQLAAPLPPCTDVRWEVVVIDSDGKQRGSRSSSFTTTGC